MSRCRIVIDLVPIRPGKGGTGSGIWTHAAELVRAMDRSAIAHDLDIHCLINPAQRDAFKDLHHIRVHHYPDLVGSVMLRLLWIHAILPLVCLFMRATVLHKLATETPLFCPARRVTTVHDFFTEFMQESVGAKMGLGAHYFAWAADLCFRKSKHVITVSKAIRDEALQRYPNTPAEVTAVQNGAEVDVADLPSTHAPGAPFTVQCVAKFMPYKGQLEALEAFAILLERTPDLQGRSRLVLHGFNNDQVYFDAISRRKEEGVLKGHVEIRSYGQAKSVADIYKDADVFLFLTCYEGFGLPIVEAQGLGIPVVCADIPVLREVGGDGVVLVDRSNAAQVAEALRTLALDKEHYMALQQKGHANVERFSWKRCAEETLGVYRSVCGVVP